MSNIAQPTDLRTTPSWHDYARWLASLGIHVFPLNPATKRPFANIDVATAIGWPEPAQGEGGLKFATTDSAAISAWWTRWPDALIGIRTGSISGIYVLDVDRKNGKDGFATMGANNWIVPNTVAGGTPSGGGHYYFAIPRDDQCRWKSDSNQIGKGLDRRGDGAYVAWYGATLSLPMAKPPTWMIGDVRIQTELAPHGNRKPLGTDHASRFSDAVKALYSTTPKEMNYDDWRNISCAFRQSASGLGIDDAMIRLTWDGWCTQYEKNIPAENNKLWRSMANGTELGWSYLRSKASPQVQAELLFGKPVLQQPNPVSTPLARSIEENAFATLVLMGTHADIATAFAIKHTGQFLYNASRKQWLRWSGTRWADLQPEAMLGNIRQFCTGVVHPDIKRPRTLAFWQSVLTTLTTMPEFLRTQEAFDADNYLLNTPDGTIDLRTGIGGPHNPTDYITAITNGSPTQTSDLWEKFINEVTCGDLNLAQSLKLMVGASLSGATEDHWIGFLWGNGRNGKSAFIEAIVHALGDYAKQVPSVVFASTKHEQHPTGLTELKGGRFAYANEVKQGTFFDVDVLKSISGDATIKARYMQGNFFQFKRTFKLFLIGNDLPQIRTQDAAIKSRLRIVPFRANFSGNEDVNLPNKLRNEAGAIMQWLLDGHKAWLEAGKRFAPCGAIKHATAAYFDAQSTPEMWLAERASLISPDVRATAALPTAAMIYSDYMAWKHLRGEVALSQTKFGIWITAQPCVEKLTSNGVKYRGIDLTSGRTLAVMPGRVLPFPQP